MFFTGCAMASPAREPMLSARVGAPRPTRARSPAPVNSSAVSSTFRVFSSPFGFLVPAKAAAAPRVRESRPSPTMLTPVPSVFMPRSATAGARVCAPQFSASNVNPPTNGTWEARAFTGSVAASPKVSATPSASDFAWVLGIGFLSGPAMAWPMCDQ